MKPSDLSYPLVRLAIDVAIGDDAPWGADVLCAFATKTPIRGLAPKSVVRVQARSAYIRDRAEGEQTKGLRVSPTAVCDASAAGPEDPTSRRENMVRFSQCLSL